MVSRTSDCQGCFELKDSREDILRLTDFSTWGQDLPEEALGQSQGNKDQESHGECESVKVSDSRWTGLQSEKTKKRSLWEESLKCCPALSLFCPLPPIKWLESLFLTPFHCPPQEYGKIKLICEAAGYNKRHVSQHHFLLMAQPWCQFLLLF